jgi:apolipoprotein N-acyltransferase
MGIKFDFFKKGLHYFNLVLMILTGLMVFYLAFIPGSFNLLTEHNLTTAFLIIVVVWITLFFLKGLGERFFGL